MKVEGSDIEPAFHKADNMKRSGWVSQLKMGF